jgi:Zn-dependent peptidase ImmA (M78 family)
VEQKSKAYVVWLILDGKAEKALELLAQHYKVKMPELKVGLPKKHTKKIMGCYSARNKTISVLDSDTLKEPFIVLHEFYHHLRTTADAQHKGTEKYANDFAKEFVNAYKTVTGEALGNN